jgi:transcriptional regulator with XRE-family HTH domain
MTLLREAIGGTLRRARTDRRRTLREVSHQARVSLGYLSEVERGRKEASSELLASICDALEFPLSELLLEVAEVMRSVADEQVQPLVPIGLRHADQRRSAPVPAGGAAPASALVSVAA